MVLTLGWSQWYNLVRNSNFLTFRSMQTAILTLQTKGQIMLPKSWRDEIGASIYQAVKNGDTIILKPVEIASDKEVMESAAKIMKKNSLLMKSLADK